MSCIDGFVNLNKQDTHEHQTVIFDVIFFYV